MSVCARLLWEVVRRRNSYRAELLFTGAPPFFLYFAVLAKLLRRVRLTYRITDFYPEVLIAEFGDRHPLLSLLRRMTWLLRRQVDRFEVLGLDQHRMLIDGGIAADRIVLRRDISPVTVTGAEPPAAASARTRRIAKSCSIRAIAAWPTRSRPSSPALPDTTATAAAVSAYG